MKLLQTSRRVPGRPPRQVLFWWTFVRGLVLAFLVIAYRVRRHGREHVPERGPIIYVANHQSHFDPPIVGVLVTDRPFSGMARATLFKSKFLSWAMRGIGVISLDQSKPDAGAMKAAIGELDAGRCVLIFPEGTRTRDGTLSEFQRGAMLLIKRSGAQVVPVAIEGAFDIWPIGKKKPRLTGRIGVKAAPAIAAEDLLKDGPDAGLERLKRAIETMRLELRTEMRSASGGRYPARGLADQPYWQHQPTAEARPMTDVAG